MPAAHHKAFLADRGVVRASGEDAHKLLDGILTCAMDRVTATSARFGALLNPQGKILFDFLVSAAPDGQQPGYYFDCARSQAADFARRLSFYRLRAKVEIENLSESHGVTASWGDTPATGGMTLADPRLPALGWRSIVPLGGNADEGPASYEAHRIGLGVPDTLKDFESDVFPHEMMMDQLQGVDFDKGCYVGQEVVSRMQHRGTARTRVMIVRAEGADMPGRGSEIASGGRAMGRIGAVAGETGLALVRIDRASEAILAGSAITSDGVVLTLEKPAYARFDFPVQTPSGAAAVSGTG